MSGFENGRLQTAARAVGLMQAAYELAVDYSNNRKVFGSNISEYQLTQVKLGRMAAVIQASRQFSYAVAKLMGQGKGQMEASMVKAYVCKFTVVLVTPRNTPSADCSWMLACCQSLKVLTKHCA
jgi:(2S)-methylsuccinyl-CoA dehydrogenase